MENILWVAAVLTLSLAAPAMGEDESLQLVNPEKLEMFVDELPEMTKIPGFSVNDGELVAGNLTIGMYETTWKFHRDLPSTKVFAYGLSRESASVPGPAIEAVQGVPTYITWENHLPSRHILPWDPTIPSATAALRPNGGVPTVVHLHGGVHPPFSDGNPNAWFTANFSSKGSAWTTPTYYYPNIQEPGSLWYHDHAMGLTRVNLLAGLAGVYNLRSPATETPLQLPPDRNLVLFDRSFRTDGSLYMNATGNNPSIHPQWQPEYFGEAIIVNGKAWPYLRVQRKRYRFRILNASNARFFRLFFDAEKSPEFTIIGSDCNYLRRSVRTLSFLLAPSETADVVIDFSKTSSSSLVLANSARYPYPTGDPVDETSGKVMKFIIDDDNNMPEDSSRVPEKLINYYVKPAVHRAVAMRYITMYEYESSTGEPMHLYLNGKSYEDPATETPRAGTSEMWWIINLTEDNHPLHIHLAAFVVIEQREIVGLEEFKQCMLQKNDAAACGVAERVAKGKVAAVPRHERGWKNVFKVRPGYVTRMLVRFALLRSDSGYPFDVAAEPGYVYHCHILDHEDNEMMRPLKLRP